MKKSSMGMLGVSVSIDSTAIAKLVANMQLLKSEVMNAAIEALDYPQELIYNRAIASVPVDTGTLRDSHFMESTFEGYLAVAVVGVGGPKNKMNNETNLTAEEYAVKRHESPRTSAKAKRRGGTWKWLEKSANSVKPAYEELLAARMRQVFDGTNESALAGNIAQALNNVADQRTGSQKIRKEKLRKNRTKLRRKKGFTDQSFKTGWRVRNKNFHATSKSQKARDKMHSQMLEETKKMRADAWNEGANTRAVRAKTKVKTKDGYKDIPF